LEKPDINRARQSARNIGAAYIVGGIVPLSAYMFTGTPLNGLTFSCIITIAYLAVFGYYKSRVTGQPPLQGAARTTFIGILAAAAAFGIARIFS
jgi:VIT1/CCC1 family predicted Fe2+/Mn2+ transporter